MIQSVHTSSLYFCGFNPGEEHFLYNTPLLPSLKSAEMDVCLMMSTIYMCLPNLGVYCQQLHQFTYST